MAIVALRPALSHSNLVMIIDDQSTGRTILEEIVRGVDKSVTTKGFASPVDAVEFAKRHAPDLILTDFKMPQMDGIEFIRQIRQIFSCVDVPIMMVTVLEDKGVRYQALEAGAADFISKPVDQHECRARCRNLLLLRRQTLLLKDRAKLLEQQVTEAVREIRTREEETLLRLAKAGEYRDLDTGNHVLRMAKYSRLISRVLGLSENECNSIELAAPMHDIGKIGVPDHILLKPGQLTPEEAQIMKTHPLIGYEILKDSPSKYLRMGAIIALGHHEKFDGTGYPSGLRGEDIPLAARIVAVADVFDALTTNRPYKRAWRVEDALDYLISHRGKHFDPDCIDGLIANSDKAMLIMDEFRDSPSAISVM